MLNRQCRPFGRFFVVMLGCALRLGWRGRGCEVRKLMKNENRARIPMRQMLEALDYLSKHDRRRMQTALAAFEEQSKRDVKSKSKSKLYSNTGQKSSRRLRRSKQAQQRKMKKHIERTVHKISAQTHIQQLQEENQLLKLNNVSLTVELKQRTDSVQNLKDRFTQTGPDVDAPRLIQQVNTSRNAA